MLLNTSFIIWMSLIFVKYFFKKNFSGNGANRYTLMHSIWQYGKGNRQPPLAACDAEAHMTAFRFFDH